MTLFCNNSINLSDNIFNSIDFKIRFHLNTSNSGNKLNKNKHWYSCTYRFLYWWKPRRFCWCSGAPQNVSPTNPELYRSLWRFGTSATTSGPDPRYPQSPPVNEKRQNNIITCILLYFTLLLIGLSICYPFLFFYCY